MKNDKLPENNSQSKNIKPSRKFWFGFCGVAIISALLIGAYFFSIIHYYPFNQDLKHRADLFGVSFSTKFCKQLNLEWKTVYQAVLDELKVKYVRLPVYWDEIEAQEGAFDFSNYDYLLDTGEKEGVKFMLVVGRRLPRWPECHSPEWADGRSETELHGKILAMIKEVVNRYKDRASIEYWQVENEPFLDSFGVCPKSDENFLKQEVSLVKSLDDRKIVITGSGELGTWRREGKIGDIFGSSLYRIVYDKSFGYFRYPFPVSYYYLQAWIAGLSKEQLMISELQGEPWAASGDLLTSSAQEIAKTMSVEQFRTNLQYAINLDFPRVYVWGAEWWYYQKKYGDQEYWWLASALFE